jgi:hypothetical protein
VSRFKITPGHHHNKQSENQGFVNRRKQNMLLVRFLEQQENGEHIADDYNAYEANDSKNQRAIEAVGMGRAVEPVVEVIVNH